MGRTNDEMFKATQNSLPADVAIFSAAVGDFKIKEKNKRDAVYFDVERLKKRLTLIEDKLKN